MVIWRGGTRALLKNISFRTHHKKYHRTQGRAHTKEAVDFARHSCSFRCELETYTLAVIMSRGGTEKDKHVASIDKQISTRGAAPEASVSGLQSVYNRSFRLTTFL